MNDKQGDTTKMPDPRDIEDGDEGFIEGTIGLEEWKVAAARVIARCWDTWDDSGERYFDQFNDNPREKLLELGYELPQGLELELERVDVKYEKKMVNGRWVNGWRDVTAQLSGKVIINVPPPPPEDERAIAIVDYQATGKSLPFTC